MTTILLIRHGACDPLGRYLAGRAPGVHLNDAGRREAEQLAHALRTVPLDALYSSPMERARETLEPLARATGLSVTIAPELTELDFGEWTGKNFAELAPDPVWAAFNERRAVTRIPGGELMAEVQGRATGFLERLARAAPDQRVAVCSHGDVIRAVVCWCLGLSLDALLRFDIAPASVTTLRLDESTPMLLGVNWRPAAPM